MFATGMGRLLAFWFGYCTASSSWLVVYGGRAPAWHAMHGDMHTSAILCVGDKLGRKVLFTQQHATLTYMT